MVSAGPFSQDGHGATEFGDAELPMPVPPFDCAAYSMMFFKVLPCQKTYNHDWTACPGAHPGERARRRCLLVYGYGAKVCPDMQTRGVCPRGESCYMTHSMFEYYMHPVKYKTKMCKGGPACRRHYCFFSHAQEELREGTCIPNEWQLQVLPDGSFSDSSVSSVLACLPTDAKAAAQAAITQLPQIMQLFENEHRQRPLRLPPPHGCGPGFDSYGSNLVNSSDSSVPSWSSLRMVQDGMAYGQPGMTQMQQVAPLALLPQHKRQVQETQLQYGAACGLGSTTSPQHCMGGAQGPAQPAQVQPLGMVPDAAAPGMSQGGYIQGGILQPAVSLASSGWVQVPQPAAMQYGVLSSAGVANPQLLYLPGNMLMSAQGEMYSQAVQQQGATSSFQPQAAYMQPGQGPILLQQQQLDTQAMPQQHVVSVPMCNAMMVCLQQQLHSPTRPHAQLQPSQALVVSAAAAPGVALSTMPQQQSLSSSMGDQLVQQLHALGLDSLHVGQQL